MPKTTGGMRKYLMADKLIRASLGRKTEGNLGEFCYDCVMCPFGRGCIFRYGSEACLIRINYRLEEVQSNA